METGLVLQQSNWFSSTLGKPPSFLKLKLNINGQAVELDPNLMKADCLPKPDRIFTGRRGRPPLDPQAFLARKKREELLKAEEMKRKVTKGVEEAQNCSND